MFKTILLAGAMALASFGAEAQSYTVNPGICGFYNTATYDCPTMTVTGPSGTAHSFSYEPLYNGRLNLIGFDTLDGLGSANVLTISTSFDGTRYAQTITFQSVDSAGVIFTGSSYIFYTTYYSRGGGGRGGGGAGWRWQITGGDITVKR